MFPTQPYQMAGEDAACRFGEAGAGTRLVVLGIALAGAR